MKTVLLLGAGASVAEAIARKVKIGDCPPTDLTFFKFIEKHKIGEFANLKDYCINKMGINIISPNVSMEAIFNMVYSLAHSQDEDYRRSQETFKDLTKILHSSIAKSTQNIATNVDGPLKKLLAHILNGSNLVEFSVITFNYDLLVEEAISQIDTNFFDIRLSYNVAHHEIVPGGPGTTNFFESVINNHSKVTILKPHGSLNWFRGTIAYAGQQVSVPLNESELIIKNGRLIPDSFNLLKDIGGSSLWASMLPAVVPPIYDKDKFYSKILSPIWKKCSEILKQCECLIFYGYSMPSADIKAQILLSSSLYRGGNRKKIHVINTNPTICESLMSKLPITSLMFYLSVDDFLKQN